MNDTSIYKKIIAIILETALRIIILMIAVSFVYKCGLSAYEFGYDIFADRPMTYGNGRDVYVTIPEGMDAMDVGKILQQRGLIRDAKLFFCQEYLSAYHKKLRSGTYTLNTGMNASKMMEIMSEEPNEEEATKDEEITSQTETAPDDEEAHSPMDEVTKTEEETKSEEAGDEVITDENISEIIDETR